MFRYFSPKPRFITAFSVLFLFFLGHQAHADSVSSICSPSDNYFELRTFNSSFQKNYDLKIKNSNGMTILIRDLSAWIKRPVKCLIKGNWGISHTIEVRAVDYFPGSNATCAAFENATIQILLDGAVFESQDFVYGECQSMETLVEYDGGGLFFCSLPDLGDITGFEDIPVWTMKVEGQGEISIDCKRIDIFSMDANRVQKRNKQTGG